MLVSETLPCVSATSSETTSALWEIMYKAAVQVKETGERLSQCLGTSANCVSLSDINIQQSAIYLDRAGQEVRLPVQVIQHQLICCT